MNWPPLWTLQLGTDSLAVAPALPAPVHSYLLSHLSSDLILASGSNAIPIISIIILFAIFKKLLFMEEKSEISIKIKKNLE